MLISLAREFLGEIFSTKKAVGRVTNFYSLRRLGVGGVLLITLLADTAFTQNITLDSPVLRPGRAMPKRYTADGKDISPPLTWSNLPQGARELVLVFEDAESGRVHWLLYRIPMTATGLREAVPSDEVLSEPAKISGSIQGITDFKDAGPGYRGPKASPDKEHRYRFILYALDARLGLLPGLDKASLMILIRDHVIGEGQLIVTHGK